MPKDPGWSSQEGACAVERLHGFLEPDLTAVKALVYAQIEGPTDLIKTIAEHLVSSGGKLLRPLLTLASARWSGYTGEGHIALAAAVEFIHCATLLHDDVVDASMLRRAQESANAIWDNKPPILVGDFLFARAFALMVTTGNMEVLRLLSKASTEISAGELMQMSIAGDLDIEDDAYLEVIRAKTATLFSAACHAGSTLAGHGESEALRAYGMGLGMAFQIADDVMDYTSSSTVMGKRSGDDFRDGKVTLPVLLAYRQGGAADRRFWYRTMTRGDQKAGDFERALEILKRTGGCDHARQWAERYAQEAQRALERTAGGDSALTDMLWQLAQESHLRVH